MSCFSTLTFRNWMSGIHSKLIWAIWGLIPSIFHIRSGFDHEPFSEVYSSESLDFGLVDCEWNLCVVWCFKCVLSTTNREIYYLMSQCENMSQNIFNIFQHQDLNILLIVNQILGVFENLHYLEKIVKNILFLYWYSYLLYVNDLNSSSTSTPPQSVADNISHSLIWIFFSNKMQS